MLHYPKIPGSNSRTSGRCIAFEKYDGTNLHWDWDRDFGWHSFGTRRDEFNLTPEGIASFAAKHAHLKEAADSFQHQLAQPLHKIFMESETYRAYQTIKIFTEFLGAESFAGLHKQADAKKLILFDVLAEPFGILGPEQFVRDFGHLPSARVVYRGKLTGAFAEDVRKNKYKTAEGVVCKGGKGGADLWMMKIKTDSYMQKLKQAFADKWEDYWE